MDRVVIYSPDQGVLLATHFQALVVQQVTQGEMVHTTAMTVVDPLMGQAVAAVGGPMEVMQVWVVLAVLAARASNPTAIVLH